MTTYRFIDAEKANHTVRMMCRVLQASRAAYYAWRETQEAAGIDADALVRVHVRGLHRASRGTYGSPRMTAALRKQGVVVNHKRVARIMREEGLQGAPRRRFRGSTTDSAHARPVAPNVLARDFTVTAPNVAWVGDITYLPVGTGWAYLAVSSSTSTAARSSGGRWTTTCARSCASLRSTVPWPFAGLPWAWCTTRTAAPSTRAPSTSRPWSALASSKA